VKAAAAAALPVAAPPALLELKEVVLGIRSRMTRRERPSRLPTSRRMENLHVSDR
jgi:hypothetical protein